MCACGVDQPPGGTVAGLITQRVWRVKQTYLYLPNGTQVVRHFTSLGNPVVGVLRFYNLRVAVKGSVRTAPTAVTWVNSLLELAKTGDKDLQATLNAWNAQAPKSDKVTGQKFLTVKNLLDLPSECRQAMFAYINKYGFDSFLCCS